MSMNDSIRPCFLLVQYLLQHEGANRDHLMELLKTDGVDISLRSFQRLLEHIRSELNLPLSYDAGKQLYTLNLVQNEQLGKFLHYCRLQLEAEFIRHQLHANRQQFVHLQQAADIQGLHWLAQLSNAIEAKKFVRARLSKSKTQQEKKYNLIPIALKKQEEWKLLAWHPKKKKWRKIPVSAIQHLELKGDALKDLPLDVNEVARHFLQAGENSGSIG